MNGNSSAMQKLLIVKTEKIKKIDVTYSHSYANFSVLKDYFSNISGEILFSPFFCFFRG